MRVPRITVLSGLLLLALTACVGPAVTDGGYRAKTAGTLNVVSSALATARYTVDLDLRGRTAFAVTDQLVSQAEADAASAQSSWLSRQPPSDAALGLHDKVEPVLQDAVSALEQLRIALRRGDEAATRARWQALDKPMNAIDQLQPVVIG